MKQAYSNKIKNRKVAFFASFNGFHKKQKKNYFDESQLWISRILSMNLECCDVPVGAEVEYHKVGFISHRYNFYLNCIFMTTDE